MKRLDRHHLREMVQANREMETQGRESKRSYPILAEAIITAKNSKEKQYACSLVIDALDDRDKELNKVWDMYERLKAKYNNAIHRIRDVQNLNLEE